MIGTDSNEVREKLQSLIVTSSCLKYPLLLSKIEGLAIDLNQEKALLFGKMGDHQKAMKILVHQLKDFKAAEDYCDKMGQNNKKELLGNLLGIYMDKTLS